MDERWRDTYDQWRTRTPDWADPLPCETCGANLHRNWHAGGWYCPDCCERELDMNSQEDSVLATEAEIMEEMDHGA